MRMIGMPKNFIGARPGRVYSWGDSASIQTASGTVVTFPQSAERAFSGLSIYGHSTQSGTPSPENPVPIVSAGSVMTTGAQLLNAQELASIRCEFAVSGDGYIIQINATVPDDNEGGFYSSLQFGLPDSYAGKTLTANYEAYETTLDNEIRDLGYVFTQADGTKGYIPHERKSGKVFTATIPENVTNIFFRLFLTESSSGSLTPGETLSAAFTGLTLCEGSTALPWEPYTGGVPGVNPYAGEINVRVSDGAPQSQTLTLSTPGGLPGIPVDSGGNYTDESGQQWVCDEIDLARGKYVQRVGKTVVDGTEIKFTADSARDYWNLPQQSAPGISKQWIAISKYFPIDVFMGNINYSFLFTRPTLMSPYFSLVDELNAFCAEKYADGQPLEIYYIMDPIETDLPAEEIAIYQALHTYSPTTTVSNDAGAWMKVEYKG